MLAQRDDATAPDSLEETAAEESPRTLAKDDAFHVLQNSRRRAVLRYLLDHPEPEQFRMRDVAEEVAARKHDTTVQRLSSIERQRVYIALYQSHLPKLDDLGLIGYNQSRGIIEPTQLAHVLDPFLEDGLHAESSSFSVDGSSTSAAGFRGDVHEEGGRGHLGHPRGVTGRRSNRPTPHPSAVGRLKPGSGRVPCQLEH